MPSLMNTLDTLLTAATFAEEGLPETALEILGEAARTEESPAQEAFALPHPIQGASR